MMPSDSSRRRKLKQDRSMLIGAAAGVVLLIIFIICGAVSGSKKEKAGADDSAVSKKVISSKLEFEKKEVPYSDISKGSLILVNDSHPYTSATAGGALVDIAAEKNEYYSIKNTAMQMNDLALKNFNSLMNGFYQECSNRDIMVTEAYVSGDRQNVIYNQALENSRVESKGGYSEHQTGLAVDLGIYPEEGKSYRYVPSGDYAWIRDNCTKYGFIQRYKDDKAENTGITDHAEHFRYVGIPHAWYMTENDLSLEEYLQALKKYAYGSKTLNVSCFDKDFEIYYIRAKDETGSGNVELYVPVNCEYSVSGNNADGFIVTIEK